MKPQIWLTCLLLILSCSFNLKNDARSREDTIFGFERTLIVYLSRTNNTKAIAEIIHEQVGGDLIALELENPYPEDYNAIVKQVSEENETSYLPPLKTKVDLSKYDTVFLGFPTWGMQLPHP